MESRKRAAMAALVALPLSFNGLAYLKSSHSSAVINHTALTKCPKPHYGALVGMSGWESFIYGAASTVACASIAGPGGIACGIVAAG